jgi:SAM-dependent MidA family methyltransferase
MSDLANLLHTALAEAPAGRLDFARVMELALYHPEQGYYGPGPRRIGRAGDFYTAVSVGPLYGRLLTDLARQVHRELGEPGDFVIIEQAAHDGQLAADLLEAGEFSLWLVEPNPRYAAVQRERLAGFAGRVNWVENLADLPALPALFVCNELPDAMPVHLLRWSADAWRQLGVEGNPAGGFHFVEGAIDDPRLVAEAARLPTDLAEGHTVEIGLAALDWLAELARAPFHGHIWIADYGLDGDERFAPERAAGTLRRYRGHQCDDRVLEELGKCDLTAHVDFSRLREQAVAEGLIELSYELQGRRLGRLAVDWLRSLEGRPPTAATMALLRQYHSLTHPAFLGRSFRVLELGKPKA